MEKTPLISVRGLSKKFSRDIKYNMYYGLLDVVSGRKAANSSPERPALRKHEFWALDNIDLDLYSGEILSVVGANGSGKTTLMRLLSNVYPRDHGTIMGREGLRITAVFALNAGMQSLYTGRENIYIKGAMYGMNKEEIDRQLEFIDDFSELGKRLDTPFGNYSSGMKARLSYAIALATEPDVFIIDEALAVGDSAFKAKCFDNLREFVTHPAKGVIFVSNHINKVMKIATRTLVMREGQLIYNSTDIKEALEFYLNNSSDLLGSQKQQRKLKKIRDYEF
ncbi:hypothetical protein CEQ90_09000 [Lewinellaceae bacterium SD302]|nr:hypothetical protein CEQ90_09000 [Lewinellaceae bacterium SD302]